MASRKKIQQLAMSIIGEKLRLPIPIKEIIKSQGVKLKSLDMNDDISGILVIEQNNSTIGFKKGEPEVRQRFTMAHELGHFILHREGELFVDKGFKTMYRPATNIPSTEWQEWEANEFAACILMPENLLREEMQNTEMDYGDNSWIRDLAGKFKVSEAAMSIRISRLGLM